MHWDVSSNVNFGPEAPASWMVRISQQDWVFAKITTKMLVAHEGRSQVSERFDALPSQLQHLKLQETTGIEAQYARVGGRYHDPQDGPVTILV